MSFITPLLRAVLPVPLRVDTSGGRYLEAATGLDLTGKTWSQAMVDVLAREQVLMVSRIAAQPARNGAQVRVNLFRRKAGWRWSGQPPEGLEGLGSIVSVETAGRHHYALAARFMDGVTLWRNERTCCEPRLRPSARGRLHQGEQAGSILVRGRARPLWRCIDVIAA